jgi:hypothetical protein
MAFKFGVDGAKNRVETIFSTGVNVGGKEITHGVVLKEDGQATKITNRLGESVFIGDDSLDALVLALQEVQRQIQIGMLKRNS